MRDRRMESSASVARGRRSAMEQVAHGRDARIDNQCPPTRRPIQGRGAPSRSAGNSTTGKRIMMMAANGRHNHHRYRFSKRGQDRVGRHDRSRHGRHGRRDQRPAPYTQMTAASATGARVRRRRPMIPAFSASAPVRRSSKCATGRHPARARCRRGEEGPACRKHHDT